jgi:putative endonuclease
VSTDRWYLYCILCADGSIYTGITTDVEKRVEAHNAGKGAKYTKGHRRPVRLLRSWGPLGESQARRYEARFKKRSRKVKELYVEDHVFDWVPFALGFRTHAEAKRFIEEETRKRHA